jgi:hypothetical protein
MHSPERILEALAWLYGGEFNVDDNVSYLKDTAYIFEPKAGSVNGQLFVIFVRNNGEAMAAWPYRRREDITNTLAHALAVTAPWEWVYDRADLPGNGYVVLTYVAEHTIWFWYVKDPGGTDFEGPDIEGNGKTEDEAKALARAAYLTWMRGRLALRGLEK